MRCWLEHPPSVTRRVGHGGLLIGRHRGCDIVIDDARVSRAQALIRMASNGPRLNQLGRNEVQINGNTPPQDALLHDGDAISLPGGTTLKIIVTQDAPGDDGHWVLADPNGGLHGLCQFPFSVGGSADDDLRLTGWPGHALVFRDAQGGVFAESATSMRIGGEAYDAGSVAPIAPGQTIQTTAGTVTIHLESSEGGPATIALPTPPSIREVRLSFLPTGGQIDIDFAHETISAGLPERRFALLVMLLVPTDGAAPGTVIDDETICAKVWPRQPEKGRVDVNVLIQRARKDLIKAGLDGFRLIERTGGGTRFRIPLGVPVHLR